LGDQRGDAVYWGLREKGKILIYRETLFIEDIKKKALEMGNSHNKGRTGGPGGGLTRDFERQEKSAQ
jgi:hypothetical protein